MDTHQQSNDHVALTPFQIFATAIFAGSSAFALLAYVLVLYILIAYFKEFKSTFYCIVISLSAADIAYLALILFYVVPCNILQRHIWAPNDYGAGLLECWSYIAQCVHLCFIGVNRLAYASLSSPNTQMLDAIFSSPPMIAFWIVFMWAVSAAIAMPIKLIGCDLIYNVDHLDFMRDCDTRNATDGRVHATNADAVLSGLLPVLQTVLNMITWFIVYTKGKSTSSTSSADLDRLAQRRKREKRILIQFTLISTVLLLFYASFWIIPELVPGKTGAVVVTLFGITSSGVNPFTYFAFNKLMKRKAKYLIFEKMLGRNPEQTTSRVTQISMTAQKSIAVKPMKMTEVG